MLSSLQLTKDFQALPASLTRVWEGEGSGEYVRVCWGFQNKAPCTGGPQQQTFIFSRFRGPEVHDRGVADSMSAESSLPGLQTAACLLPSRCFLSVLATQ